MEFVNKKALYVYGVAGSGNSQKAMLGCSLLGIQYELRVVNNLIGPDAEKTGGAKSPEYLKMNKRGLVPVIIDPNHPLATDASSEGLVVSDSTSILTYLALTYNPKWYPVDNILKVTKINGWMTFAANEIHNSLLKVRVKNKFGWDISPVTYEFAIDSSKKVLTFLNEELTAGEALGNIWLVEGDSPSIADIHVFPYVAFTEHSSDSAILLSDYPAVSAWLDRVKSLPGYIPLPGI